MHVAALRGESPSDFFESENWANFSGFFAHSALRLSEPCKALDDYLGRTTEIERR